MTWWPSAVIDLQLMRSVGHQSRSGDWSHYMLSFEVLHDLVAFSGHRITANEVSRSPK
jgi:hypothetical protein